MCPGVVAQFVAGGRDFFYQVRIFFHPEPGQEKSCPDLVLLQDFQQARSKLAAPG